MYICNFIWDKICNLILEIRFTWNAWDISYITIPEEIISLILIARESKLKNHLLYVNLLTFVRVPRSWLSWWTSREKKATTNFPRTAFPPSEAEKTRGKAHITRWCGERAARNVVSGDGERERERQEKKLDQSLSGERFNEDDLIRSAAELQPSKRILTSIAGRESSGENCRQLFPKSRADALALSAREYSRYCCENVCVYVFARKRCGGGVAGAPRRSWCVNHSAQLRQLPDRSQVSTLSAYAATSPFPTPSSIHASRKSWARASLDASNASAADRHAAESRWKFDDNFLAKIGGCCWCPEKVGWCLFRLLDA